MSRQQKNRQNIGKEPEVKRKRLDEDEILYINIETPIENEGVMSFEQIHYQKVRDIVNRDWNNLIAKIKQSNDALIIDDEENAASTLNDSLEQPEDQQMETHLNDSVPLDYNDLNSLSIEQKQDLLSRLRNQLKDLKSENVRIRQLVMDKYNLASEDLG